MADPEQLDDQQDNFVAEVSDLRPSAKAVPAERPAPFLSRAYQTPRQRIMRLVIIVVAPLLVLLIVLGTNPALRAGLGSIIRGGTSAAAIPSNDLFYLLPNPPGVDVLLDGRILAHPPAPDNPHPLKLAAGNHTFAWRSHMLPFKPLQCTVSVPHLSANDCPIVQTSTLPIQLANRPGAIIGMQESLDTLEPQDTQQLASTIQAALDAIESTTTVQPGEAYTASNIERSPTIAQEPLRAIRQYQFVYNTGYPEPCILGQPAIPCRFPGQDCNSLCTVEQPPASITGSGGVWIAAAFVSTTWAYFTADDQVIALQVAETFGLQLAVLRITHDAGKWHVSAVVGHTPGLDAADDMICDPARYALSQTSSWSFMVTDPPPGTEVHFVSGPTPTDGCVIEIDYGGPALFLQRFGVLLAVNNAAQNPVDNLPMADATEQAIARQLMARLPS